MQPNQDQNANQSQNQSQSQDQKQDQKQDHEANQNQTTTTVELPRGTLSLKYATKPISKDIRKHSHTQSSTHGQYQLDDLLDFAERINPKRAFLFVSKVLGRHIPVAPSTMRQAFTDLTQQLIDAGDTSTPLPQPIIVVGMAETAVGLSAGVHQVLQRTYPDALLLNSTRHAQHDGQHPIQSHDSSQAHDHSQAGDLLTKFSEDHSHASTHLIYQSHDIAVQQQLFASKTLIMVDDEASTGTTCKNLVNALRDAGLQQLEQVHLLTLVDWSLERVQTNPFANIDFYRHHLLSGSWQWTDKPSDSTVDMPKVDSTSAGSYPLLNTGNWGRFPTRDTTQGLVILQRNLLAQLSSERDSASFKGLSTFKEDKNLDTLKKQKILVLGSNEFVWLPFLLAEWLQSELLTHDSVVKFASLTRSPINLGNAIKHKLSFHDNYGLGMINFVYNVDPDKWDSIILCIETAKDSVDPMWQLLDNVTIVSPEY